MSHVASALTDVAAVAAVAGSCRTAGHAVMVHPIGSTGQQPPHMVGAIEANTYAATGRTPGRASVRSATVAAVVGRLVPNHLDLVKVQRIDAARRETAAVLPDDVLLSRSQ